VLAFFDGVAQTMSKCTALVMTLTPLGVFGAMAYNVSHMPSGHRVDGVLLKGWAAVGHLLNRYSLLAGSLHLALALLFMLVFTPVAWLSGIRILPFVKAIKDPALTAFSAASSRVALPNLLEAGVPYGAPAGWPAS
jgi:proton glutamate symport protein